MESVDHRAHARPRVLKLLVVLALLLSMSGCCCCVIPLSGVFDGPKPPTRTEKLRTASSLHSPSDAAGYSTVP